MPVGYLPRVSHAYRQREEHVQADDECVRDLSGATGSDDVLQVGTQRQPRRELRAVVDLGKPFIGLHADRTWRHRVAITLESCQPWIDLCGCKDQREEV